MKIMEEFFMKCMEKILCQVPPNSKVLKKEMIRESYISLTSNYGLSKLVVEWADYLRSKLQVKIINDGVILNS